MRLAAAAIALVLVAGCGGGDDSKNAAGKAGSYEVKLPSDWVDRTKQISNQDNPIRFDRVFVTTFEDGFRTNVSVVRQRKASGVDLDGVAKASQRQTHDVYGASGFAAPRSTTVGSEDARAYTYRLKTETNLLRGEQVIAGHAGRLYYITFTAETNAYARRHAEFARMLGSWRWN